MKKITVEKKEEAKIQVLDKGADLSNGADDKQCCTRAVNPLKPS